MKIYVWIDDYYQYVEINYDKIKEYYLMVSYYY